MKFFRSRAGAATVLVFVVIFSTVFGSHRSLAAEAGRITAQGQDVRYDLERRVSVGSNLYNLLNDWHYLSLDEPAMRELQDAVSVGLAQPMDQGNQDALLTAIEKVFTLAEGLDGMLEEHAGYLSNFQAQLESIDATLARDPYNALAAEFNNVTLGTFPANILKTVAGVDELPIYH